MFILLNEINKIFNLKSVEKNAEKREILRMNDDPFSAFVNFP